LDTVSRQIFEDIQETQFSGSKMEINVHLNHAFQAELETEGSRLGLPPTPRSASFILSFLLEKLSEIRVLAAVI